MIVAPRQLRAARRSARRRRSRPSPACSRRAAPARTARRAARRRRARRAPPAPPSTAVGFIRQRVSCSLQDAPVDVVVVDDQHAAGRRAAASRSPASAASATSNAAVKWNVLPAPGSLSTQMRPPISCTSVAEIASPRPVPPNRRVVEPSAWLNASKIVACLLRRDADAGVADREVQHACRSPRALFAHLRPPRARCSVNLMALPTRLRAPAAAAPDRRRRRRARRARRRTTSSSPFWCARDARAACSVSSTTSRERERHRLELELARLDLREVEDVVEDRQQRLGRAS